MDKEIILERIEEKFKEIEIYLEEFNSFEIPDFEEYQRDIKLKAASERYFEKVVEAIISTALLLIRYKELKQPDDEEHAFFILSKNNIITEELAKRLRDAKDMRNIVIHNYIKVEDLLVYQAVTEEIIRDAEEFLESISKALKYNQE